MLDGLPTVLVRRRQGEQRRDVDCRPVRLLSLHACELFLKAYLREKGLEPDQLRGHGHVLEQLLALGTDRGLRPRPQTVAQLAKLMKRHDYVRGRYSVVEDGADISSGSALGLAEDVRDAVCVGLGYDENGRLNGTSTDLG